MAEADDDEIVDDSLLDDLLHGSNTGNTDDAAGGNFAFPNEKSDEQEQPPEPTPGTGGSTNQAQGDLQLFEKVGAGRGGNSPNPTPQVTPASVPVELEVSVLQILVAMTIGKLVVAKWWTPDLMQEMSKLLPIKQTPDIIVWVTSVMKRRTGWSAPRADEDENSFMYRLRSEIAEQMGGEDYIYQAFEKCNTNKTQSLCSSTQTTKQGTEAKGHGCGPIVLAFFLGALCVYVSQYVHYGTTYLWWLPIPW